MQTTVEMPRGREARTSMRKKPELEKLALALNDTSVRLLTSKEILTLGVIQELGEGATKSAITLGLTVLRNANTYQIDQQLKTLIKHNLVRQGTSEAEGGQKYPDVFLITSKGREILSLQYQVVEVMLEHPI